MTAVDRRPEQVRHQVVVRDGFDGVTRLVSLLRQRRYRVLSLDAHRPGPSDTWVVTYAVELGHYAENLLVKRVNRLASVVRVRGQRAQHTDRTAGAADLPRINEVTP